MNKLYKHDILGVFGSARVRSKYAICKNLWNLMEVKWYACNLRYCLSRWAQQTTDQIFFLVHRARNVGTTNADFKTLYFSDFFHCKRYYPDLIFLTCTYE